AAVAIENAQLVQRLNLFNEQLEQRVAQRTRQLAETLEDLTDERDRVETLYQITRELSTSLDLDRVLAEALNLINRAIGISHGSILLLDHGSGELIYRAALGRDKPLPRGGSKTRYRLGSGLAGAVMELQEARLVPDLSKDPDWIPGKDREIPDQRSAMAVPLATGEGLMGALLLFHPDMDYFTEDHLKLVSAAGAQIANAINNAELYRLITDQAERLGIMLRSQATEAAKNEAILKGIADGVLVLDAHRHVVLLNPKGAEILCVVPKSIENRPVDLILDQAQTAPEREFTRLFYNNLREALVKIEAGQNSVQFRLELRGKAVVVALTPVALGAEETLGVVAVLRDISKEAEVERLKNEFISTVSHELRTPLTSIKGYADLLVSRNPQVGELTPLQDRFVKVIQSNANRLTDLVNDILEISRIETGRVKIEPETIDIIELIKEVAVSFEGQLVQKSLDLSLALPDELPAIYADRGRLTQVLVNLIGNAWQYTPEEGKIIVSAHLVKNKFVQVDVADTGIGILKEDVDHIFERFFRSERHEVQLVDGTGLGLYITKSFVELLGGKIWLESQVDVGTTFSFTVPLATPPDLASMSSPELAQDTSTSVE
ncbi:MAG: ATP-binding protein, partial [Chloroflexota bacterium]